MSARFFAIHDDALRNGSCEIIRSTRDLGRYRAHYVNGDYMGAQDILSAKLVPAVVARLTEEGFKEYTAKEFKALAPACIGGNGGR